MKETKKIKVLSLFNGMNCIGLALSNLGIEFELYAAEIDKHANKVSNALFPNTINLGDVRTVKPSELPAFDLVVAGSPCQGFSKAGNQLNFEHPKSILFFEFVRILNECKAINPNLYFLLENVEMKKTWEAVITQYIGINPVAINSKLLCAQSRPRVYWTNINQNTDNLFGFPQCGIPQPKDRHVYLKDILECDADEKYFISDIAKKTVLNPKRLKKQYCAINGEKSLCLTASGTNNLNGTHIAAFACRQVGRKLINGKRADNADIKAHQQLEPRFDSKTNCLTTVQKDNYLLLIKEATKKGFAEIKDGECFDFSFPDSKTRRGRKMDKKSHTLTTKKPDFMLFKDLKIRRLTEKECMRLQTIPKWAIDKIQSMLDNKEVSSTQVYRMLGNGWTVDVISYILGFMK